MKLKVTPSLSAITEPAEVAYDVAAYWKAVKGSPLQMEFDDYERDKHSLCTIISNETEENLRKLADEITATYKVLYGNDGLPSFTFFD